MAQKESTVSISAEDASLIGGTSLGGTSVELAAASRENRFHTALDATAGISSFFFNAAVHAAGQSNFIHSVSMFLSGTCLLTCSQVRWRCGAKKETRQLEICGSWIWMLSSVQQFYAHRQLKWAGYSSWSGMLLAMYLTLNYIVSPPNE
jgi:hypothetical protein